MLGDLGMEALVGLVEQHQPVVLVEGDDGVGHAVDHVHQQGLGLLAALVLLAQRHLGLLAVGDVVADRDVAADLAPVVLIGDDRGVDPVERAVPGLVADLAAPDVAARDGPPHLDEERPRVMARVDDVVALADQLLPPVAADAAERVVDVGDPAGAVGDGDDGVLVEGGLVGFELRLHRGDLLAHVLGRAAPVRVQDEVDEGGPHVLALAEAGDRPVEGLAQRPAQEIEAVDPVRARRLQRAGAVADRAGLEAQKPGRRPRLHVAAAAADLRQLVGDLFVGDRLAAALAGPQDDTTLLHSDTTRSRAPRQFLLSWGRHAAPAKSPLPAGSPAGRVIVRTPPSPAPPQRARRPARHPRGRTRRRPCAPARGPEKARACLRRATRPGRRPKQAPCRRT